MKASHETLYYKNSAIFNTIGYLMVIGVNALAGLGLINGNTTAQVSEKYDNLFVPAGFTFSIWGLIYLALIGFIIYQLWLAFASGHEDSLEQFMERMRGWWLISCMANSCWLFAWHYELLPLAILLMLTLLISLLAIHINFNIAAPGASRAMRWFVFIPFSLYLGWICVATVANIAALLVYSGWDGMSVPVTAILILVACAGATLLVVKRHNIVAGMVAIWAFYGIIAKRQSEVTTMALPVIICCLSAIGVVLVAGIRELICKKE
ncbi:hypothetical protein [Chitinophaga sancti]|uniref:TspO and MBR related proteins n=1 Tax=Chitinophaga sancti TaxID=1004 RepID=A0A1K1MHT2_9BACT|nr:hypothetical protein [Chitinophaga sancti]WQD62698.1 hypothetical protein U0033_32910 [Chitinophaga sancti]WQG91678.1 hypothetical protein SR876_09195 [Chitinophaga sancti]SFW22651.1 hypothetical protein SAMN05661012_00587 [Chitinophaga sancti]